MPVDRYPTYADATSRDLSAHDPQVLYRETGDRRFVRGRTFTADNMRCCDEPNLILPVPASGGSVVAPEPMSIALTFNIPVRFATGEIEIRDNSDNSVLQTFIPGSEAMANGAHTLGLTPAPSLVAGNYSLVVPLGAIQSLDAIQYVGLAPGEYTFTVT